MSSATDPYQPAESQYRITRSILEVFRELPVGLLLLQTRSPLVERDSRSARGSAVRVALDDRRDRRRRGPACPHADLPEHRAPLRRDAPGARTRHRRAGRRQPHAAARPRAPCRTDRRGRRPRRRRHVHGRRRDRTAHGASRPLPARFAELGYGDWRDERAARALHEELCGIGSARSASVGPWRASTRLRNRLSLTRIVMSRMCRVSGQGACKPNSVPPSKSEGGDDHPSRTAVARRLQRPTRERSRTPLAAHVARCAPLFGLAPGGVCPAAPFPGRRCALTAPFHPYRLGPRPATAVCFCGTFRRLTPPGR